MGPQKQTRSRKEDARRHYLKYRSHIIERVKKYQLKPDIKIKRTEYAVWYAINKKYKVTKEQWFTMYKEQQGKCGMCAANKPPIPRQLVVDHCHTSNRVRKLLCQRCNHAMGVVDNTELLEQALRYKNGT
jgi:Recombination endonuclease VII